MGSSPLRGGSAPPCLSHPPPPLRSLNPSFPLGLVAPSLFFRLLDVCVPGNLVWTSAQPSVFDLLHSPRPAEENSGLFSIMTSSSTQALGVLVTSSHHSCRLGRGLTLMALLGGSASVLQC